MVLIFDIYKRKFLRFGDDFEVHVSSLGHVEIPMTHPQFQCNQENWDCLDKSGWSLDMMRVSVASVHPRDCVGRTLLRSPSSVNLRGGFDESSPYWRLIRPIFFWKSIDDLMLPFHGRLRLYLDYERLKDASFWINLKVLTSVFKSFRPFKYKFQNVIGFCWRFTQFNTKVDIHSLLHASSWKHSSLTELLLMNCRWLDMLTPAMCW
jgi:hypothetical protein